MNLERNDEERRRSADDEMVDDPHSQNDDLDSQNDDLDSQTNQGAEVEINQDLSHIEQSKINTAGGDLFTSDRDVIVYKNCTFINNGVTLKKDTSRQAKDIKSSMEDDFASQHQALPTSTDPDFQKNIDHWFEYELKTDREKFYVVTLSIFNSVKYPDFKDIYGIILGAMEIEDE